MTLIQILMVTQMGKKIQNHFILQNLLGSMNFWLLNLLYLGLVVTQENVNLMVLKKRPKWNQIMLILRQVHMIIIVLGLVHLATFLLLGNR